MKLPGKRAKEGTRGGGSAAQQAQSEEVLRVRARRRLIGAVALVLTGVVVFPLIFETQPKPVASNIALVIPPQDQASSVARPAPATTPSAAAAVAAPGSAARAQLQPQPQPQVQPQVPREVQPQPQPQPQAQVQPHPPQVQAAAQAPAKAQARAPEQPQPPQRDVAAQAPAAATPPAAADARYVVQAGAYADAHTAQQVRRRIEAVGLHTYTQVIDTPAGKRVRVRAGPFSSHSQAEHALKRIQALGIAAAVLDL